MIRVHKRVSALLRRCAFAGIVLFSASCCSDATPAPPTSTVSAAGLWAHAGPDTGELVAPTSEDTIRSEAGGAAALPPLEIVPGRTVAGGVMVDLRGHFSYGLRASVSNDGRLAGECVEYEAHQDE